MGKKRRENERLEQQKKNKTIIYSVLTVLVIIALIVISIILNTKEPDVSDVKKLTKGEIEFNEKVLKADKPVLVDYYADWCQPCVMMAPIIQELELEQEDFYVYKVDVDVERNLADDAGARSIPYFVLYNNGEFIKSTVGVQTKENLIKFVKDNI